MIEHIVKAYRRFTTLTTKFPHKRSVRLAVVSLEERATPAADIFLTIEPPEMVAIAEIAPVALAQDGLVAKPIVRVDLMPAGSSMRIDDAVELDEWLAATDSDESAFARKEQETETAEIEDAGQSITVEMLATEEDLLDVQQAEELR